MGLINLDGLTLIGQGSEWFWSMLQFVVVTVTLLAVYRQVRLQADAAAIQQMDALVTEWRSEAMTRHTLSITTALRDGTPPEAVPYGAASTIGDFWEGIGYLVREGHIDRRLLYENLGNGARWWWTALRPWAMKVRVEPHQRDALDQFEWLAGQMALMDQAAGDQVVYDQALIASTLDDRIQNDRDRIRTAEEVRAIIVRPSSTASILQPQAADQSGGPLPGTSPELS
jgi:hypothetical protein